MKFKKDLCPSCNKLTYSKYLDWCYLCGMRKRGRYIPEEKSSKKKKTGIKVEAEVAEAEDFFNEVNEQEAEQIIQELPF